jgi:hypothetical protein
VAFSKDGCWLEVIVFGGAYWLGDGLLNAQPLGSKNRIIHHTSSYFLHLTPSYCFSFLKIAVLKNQNTLLFLERQFEKSEHCQALWHILP